MDRVLKYLNAFAAVAEQGSISLAAKELGVAQPAISRQMKLLEEGMGAPLLDREYDGIHLTPAGKKLRDHLLPWLHDLESLRNAFAGEEGGGLIRFGTLAEAGQSFFMPRILRYTQSRRDVDFDISYAKEFELKELFKQGKLDFLVTTSPVQAKGVYSEPIVNERVVLVARFSYRQQVNSASDFRHSRFIAYRQLDPLLNAYAKKHYPTLDPKELNLVLAVNSHRSMIDALLTTDAVAVMPWQSISDHIPTKTLRVASSRELSGQLHLSCKASLAETNLGRNFIDHMMRVGSDAE